MDHSGIAGSKPFVDSTQADSPARSEASPAIPSASPGSRRWRSLAIYLNRRWLWHRLPGRLLGYANLLVQRIALQRFNLVDTGLMRPIDSASLGNPGAEAEDGRTADGSFNNLRCPYAGMAGTRFGRNVPLQDANPDKKRLYCPDATTIADRLLTRGEEEFQPAESLNLLAAAWIQFMVHDWLTHAVEKNRYLHVPPDGHSGAPAADPIPATKQDPARAGEVSGRPPAYANEQTHWWDGSQIYGSNDPKLRELRSERDGEMRIGEDGLLDVKTSVDDQGKPVESEQSGVTGNWWIGLSMFHTLFVLEHNAICRHLREKYRDDDRYRHLLGNDDWLFSRARMINAALMAKIHTLEWTPTTGAHPSLKLGVRLAWRGILGFRNQGFIDRCQRLRTWPKWLVRVIDRCGPLHAILTGIPGSPTRDHGVPFSMTEEFAAVYRMHPLLPDQITFRAAQDDAVIGESKLEALLGEQARKLAQQIGMSDLFYSFAVSHPGAVCLHNYPRSLRPLRRKSKNGELSEEEILDVAAIDIMRDRERGVPRYNDFRKQLHLPRVENFEELNRSQARELAEVYGNNIDDVDLMVGMFAEAPPRGFAFSDTAFRVFILMASRRLEADRFFTSHYNEDVYTTEGIKWVEENDLKKVLLRHYPKLEPVVSDTEWIFAPWSKQRSKPAQAA